MQVSVVIPVFNTARFLRQCLDSVVGQTLSDIEVICVDDGSADGSLDIAREYEARDGRVRVLTQNNKGGGAARNAGIEVARGDYLFFLDSDDWLECEALEKLVLKSRDEDADVVIFPAFTYDDNTGRQWDTQWVFVRDNFPEKDVFNFEDMPKTIFNTFGNVPWNKLFKRAFVEAHGLRFQEIFRTNDAYFVCRALILADRMTVFDESLVYYRVGTGSNSQATNSREPLGFYKAFSALRRFLISEGCCEIVEESFVNHAMDAVIYNLSSLKDRKSFELISAAVRQEAEGSLGISLEDSSRFRDPMQYDLYRVLVESDEEDLMFNWALALLSQRNETLGSFVSQIAGFESRSFLRRGVWTRCGTLLRIV